jgi:hypothetical protein
MSRRDSVQRALAEERLKGDAIVDKNFVARIEKRILLSARQSTILHQTATLAGVVKHIGSHPTNRRRTTVANAFPTTNSARFPDAGIRTTSAPG